MQVKCEISYEDLLITLWQIGSDDYNFMFYYSYDLELTSKKAEGEFEIALSLLEHCEAPPIPGIFSFQHEKSRSKKCNFSGSYFTTSHT